MVTVELLVLKEISRNLISNEKEIYCKNSFYKVELEQNTGKMHP